MAHNLKDFQFSKVLSQDTLTRKVAVLGSLPQKVEEDVNLAEDQDEHTPLTAIALIEKTHFPEENLDAFINAIDKQSSLAENDIYTWLHGWKNSNEPSPDVKVTLICPATETHIKKYSEQSFKVVCESPEQYANNVLPYIHSFPPDRIQWVYNILDHTAEADRIIYEDPSDDLGFIILPDLKWDGYTMASLYLQCIVRPRNIYTLRELETKHLPMLQNIRTQGLKAISEKYNVSPDDIRMLVHYQPSYYHFHVHLVHVTNQNVGISNAHHLNDLIDLLQLEKSLRESSSYINPKSLLAQKSITYTLGTNHGLYAKFFPQ